LFSFRKAAFNDRYLTSFLEKDRGAHLLFSTICTMREIQVCWKEIAWDVDTECTAVLVGNCAAIRSGKLTPFRQSG
jgi:hypothetical protein